MTLNSTPYADEGLVQTGLARKLAELWGAARRRRRIAATVRVLSSLDERILEDIGVPRRSIRDVATRLEGRTDLR